MKLTIDVNSSVYKIELAAPELHSSEAKVVFSALSLRAISLILGKHIALSAVLIAISAISNWSRIIKAKEFVDQQVAPYLVEFRHWKELSSSFQANVIKNQQPLSKPHSVASTFLNIEFTQSPPHENPQHFSKVHSDGLTSLKRQPVHLVASSSPLPPSGCSNDLTSLNQKPSQVAAHMRAQHSSKLDRKFAKENSENIPENLLQVKATFFKQFGVSNVKS